MKIYECRDCMDYGGREPCFFILGDGAIDYPTLCPCADTRLPDARWKGPINKKAADGQAKANKCQDCDDFHKAGMECWRCDSPPPSIFLTDRLNKNSLTIGQLWSILRLAVYNTKKEDQNSDVVYNLEEMKHQLDVINEVIGQIERFHAQIVKDKNA